MVKIRIDSKEQDFKIGKKIGNLNFKKIIFPISKHTHLELPYLVMNLSISQLY